MHRYKHPVKPDASKPRALIVDDSAETRRVVRTIIEVLDLVIEEASDGGEALSMLAARDYELVVTDLEMAPRNGFDLMSGLAALPPGRRRPQVIVCSALVGVHALYGRPELAEAAALLPKPIRSGELLGEVIKVLNDTEQAPT